MKLSEFEALSKEDKYLYIAATSEYLRKIMQAKYIDGKSWHQIAMSIGKGTSVDSIKSAVQRYLKKF